MIASIVQLVEIVIEKFSAGLYSSLVIFLPLIAVNCAILGGSLFMQLKDFSGILESGVYGFGSGVGWYLAIVAIASIREKISFSFTEKETSSSATSPEKRIVKLSIMRSDI